MSYSDDKKPFDFNQDTAEGTEMPSDCFISASSTKEEPVVDVPSTPKYSGESLMGASSTDSPYAAPENPYAAPAAPANP